MTERICAECSASIAQRNGNAMYCVPCAKKRVKGGKPLHVRLGEVEHENRALKHQIAELADRIARLEKQAKERPPTNVVRLRPAQPKRNPADVPKRRTCVGCGTWFESGGIGNRMCQSCRDRRSSVGRTEVG